MREAVWYDIFWQAIIATQHAVEIAVRSIAMKIQYELCDFWLECSYHNLINDTITVLMYC